MFKRLNSLPIFGGDGQPKKGIAMFFRWIAGLTLVALGAIAGTILYMSYSSDDNLGGQAGAVVPRDEVLDLSMSPLSIGDHVGLYASVSPDRKNAVPLDGATITGKIYVFAIPTGVAKRAKFWVNSPEMSGKPDQIENKAPYDVAGGSPHAAKALNTALLVNGTNSVTVEFTMNDKGTESATATFVVTAPSGTGETTTTTKATTSTTVESPTTTVEPATTTTSPSTTSSTAPGGGTPPPGAVVLRPGDDIQRAVDSNPAGTTFYLKQGVYKRQWVKAKDGDTFVGEPGAILSGEGVTERAFNGSARNVTIRGLIIEKYSPDPQQGVIGQAGDGWLIEGNEVRYNSGVGIHTGQASGYVVRNNYVHHNGQLGVKAQGSNVVFEGNEIAYNNTDGHDIKWEAGGGKFLKTNGLILRNNYVHDNVGHGIWLDTDNINCRIENNTVNDNGRNGIFHETGYDCLIKGNTVMNNVRAGIWIAASSNTEVVGNVVVGNRLAGIGGSQDPRGSGAHGVHEVKNLYVHDNVIKQTSGPDSDSWGWSGVQQSTGDTSIFTSKNNRFVRNTYVVTSDIEKPFKWNDRRLTWNEWQAYGHDNGGSFSRS